MKDFSHYNYISTHTIYIALLCEVRLAGTVLVFNEIARNTHRALLKGTEQCQNLGIFMSMTLMTNADKSSQST